MNPRRPDHLKELAGTARRDRVAPATATLPMIDGMPTTPGWLTNLDAVKEWNRLAPVLIANKLLHAGNVGLFGQMCALHGLLVLAWTSGKPPTAALISSYRLMLSDLGLRNTMIPVAPEKPNRFHLNVKQR